MEALGLETVEAESHVALLGIVDADALAREALRLRQLLGQLADIYDVSFGAASALFAVVGAAVSFFATHVLLTRSDPLLAREADPLLALVVGLGHGPPIDVQLVAVLAGRHVDLADQFVQGLVVHAELALSHFPHKLGRFFNNRLV